MGVYPQHWGSTPIVAPINVYAVHAQTWRLLTCFAKHVMRLQCLVSTHLLNILGATHGPATTPIVPTKRYSSRARSVRMVAMSCKGIRHTDTTRNSINWMNAQQNK